MIGNRVDVKLRNPDETFYGELRRQNVEGVWVFKSQGYAQYDELKFLPMHRVVEVLDRGRSPSF